MQETGQGLSLKAAKLDILHTFLRGRCPLTLAPDFMLVSGQSLASFSARCEGITVVNNLLRPLGLVE